MPRLRILSLLFLVSMITACRFAGDEAIPSPTPFPVLIPAQRVTTAAPIPISLDNLAANPDFYVGATLQLSGQFKRLPLLSCEGESYPSPASWGLQADGFLANASGMDEQLRALLSDNQSITVEGRWLRFEGSIGCQGNQQQQTIWYLSTDRVLDPHPLVRQQILLEDTLPATEIVQAPPTESIPPTATAISVPSPSPLPSATLDIAPTITVIPEASASAPGTPAASASATVDSLIPTATRALTSTPATAVSSTPAPTAGTTPTTAIVTPGSTSVPPANQVDRGELDVESLAIGALSETSTDRWALDLSSGSSITITVAPGSMANIVFSLRDSTGDMLVNNHNTASQGEIETIRDVAISDPGIYDLLISTDTGTATDYAVMYMDEESYSFLFRGRLSENSTRSDNLAANTDHFWFFNVQNGESVSFTVTPTGSSDPYIELYDPDGSRMLTIDDTGDSEAESLSSYTLLDDGMYGIRVAEFDFQPMSYQIVLSKT